MVARPRFSVVTPTKDRHDWLPRCLASVRTQTFTDYEHLIFDNGDEPCEDVLPHDDKVRYVRGEANGPADAFDQAIKLAEGQIITLLSDDDRLASRALEVYDRYIGDAHWITGLTDFQEDGRSRMILGGPLDLNRLKQDYYLGGAIAWKRELTERLGGMDSDFDSAADYDLYLRFAEDSTPVFVDQVLYLYTYWPGVDSIVNAGRQQDSTARIKEAR